jgi:hypothetical protein
MLPIHASPERVDISSIQPRGNLFDQFDKFLDPFFKADSQAKFFCRSFYLSPFFGSSRGFEFIGSAPVCLAAGVLGEGGVEIQEATLRTRERAAAIVIAGGVRDAQDALLIATDAPLGWPKQ